MTTPGSALARKLRGFMTDISGATAIEYTIMASCIALAIIATVALISGRMRAIYESIAAGLS